MAEAHAIARIGDETQGAPVKLSYSEEGLHFDLHITIPTVRETLRRTKLRALGLSNNLRNSVFPLHPLAAVGLLCFGVILVLNSPSKSWFRSGWLATFVWDASLKFHSLDRLSLSLRVGILAAFTTFLIVLLIATLQRCLLRLLLRYKGFLYNARKPTLFMRLWGILMKVLIGYRKHRLYSFQGVLPSLPVPSLEDTCKRYLDAAEPLQTPEQFQITKGLVADFLSGVGPKLQRYLVLKSWYASNYVTDWWEKYVYLKGRSPIVINSNYYVLDEANFVPTKIPEARMAVILYNMLRYREKLESEELEPTMLGGGIVPLCMEQFRRVFSTTRIPGRECDSLKHWTATNAPLHVVVLCNGSMYKLEVVKSGGSPVLPHEFEKQLTEIKADAMSRTPDLAESRIPALTSEQRTRWAEIREMYFSEGVNRRSLQTVESSLLFLHLDIETEDIETWTGRGRSLIHGTGATRWFDKSLNLVVFKNGHSGLNAEHSFADAPVVAHLYEVTIIAADKNSKTMYEEDGHAKVLKGTSSVCARDSLTQWQRINWALPRPAEEAIHTAFNNVTGLINDLDLQVSSYKKYGKGFMKNCKVSPDAFIQMAMQLAYYRDAGKFSATYEASMTRLYKHGRTETVRPVSRDSVKFVKTMLDPSASPEDKLKALQKAAASHQEAYMNSMTGKGLDRHLFALYIVSKGMGVESPFLQAALSEPWRLSTSQQPQNQTGLWDPRAESDQFLISPGGGFGPVADDGYGVSYMVAKEDETFFHVSSKKSCALTDSTRFLDNLSKSFDDMGELLNKVKAKKED